MKRLAVIAAVVAVCAIAGRRRTVAPPLPIGGLRPPCGRPSCPGGPACRCLLGARPFHVQAGPLDLFDNAQAVDDRTFAGGIFAEEWPGAPIVAVREDDGSLIPLREWIDQGTRPEPFPT